MTTARDAAREAGLASLLDAVVAGRIPAWLESPTTSDPEWDCNLRGLALVFSLRWHDAVDLVAALPAVGEDDQDAWWLRRAVAVWGASGDLDAPDPLAGLGGVAPGTGGVLGRFAGHVLVEATMAHGRLDLAAEVADLLGPALTQPLVLAGRTHDFSVMSVVCVARVRAFRGDIAAADAVLHGLAEPAPGLLRALVAGTASLVRGNDADAADVRRFVAEVDRYAPDPDDLLSAGAHMLASFGEIALADVAAAARRVLVAGGDADLSRLNVIDRALGLEMLTTLAVADHDLDAAEAWADRLTPLLASPMADSTAARTLSRVALLAGRADEAVAWAERAVARAREVDRVIEYAEGEIVLSRARLSHPGTSGGEAARALRAMVSEAERRGHRVARRAAARELKAAGLRLPPASGSGWAGLTAREAEVARLAALGESNGAIAESLHLSAHTVRAHVSRALAAFAVPTRAALPAAMGGADRHPGERPGLTARQREVAALVADGWGNDRIAEQLGLSQRTVERHVSDILERWSLPNRTAIAQVWVGG